VRLPHLLLTAVTLNPLALPHPCHLIVPQLPLAAMEAQIALIMMPVWMLKKIGSIGNVLKSRTIAMSPLGPVTFSNVAPRPVDSVACHPLVALRTQPLVQRPPAPQLQDLPLLRQPLQAPLLQLVQVEHVPTLNRSSNAKTKSVLEKVSYAMVLPNGATQLLVLIALTAVMKISRLAVSFRSILKLFVQRITLIGDFD